MWDPALSVSTMIAVCVVVAIGMVVVVVVAFKPLRCCLPRYAARSGGCGSKREREVRLDWGCADGLFVRSFVRAFEMGGQEMLMFVSSRKVTISGRYTRMSCK